MPVFVIALSMCLQDACSYVAYGKNFPTIMTIEHVSNETIEYATLYLLTFTKGPSGGVRDTTPGHGSGKNVAGIPSGRSTGSQL